MATSAQITKILIKQLNGNIPANSTLFTDYVSLCKQNHVQPQIADLYQIQRYLGYSEGWVYHRCIELEIEWHPR